MSATTGPILAAGGVVIFNAVVIHGQQPLAQTRTAVATGIAAAGLHLAERAFPTAAVALAWLVFVATLMVRVDPATPAPIESFATWYREA